MILFEGVDYKPQSTTKNKEVWLINSEDIKWIHKKQLINPNQKKAGKNKVQSNKKKTNTNIIDLNSNTLVITLNVNG